MTKPELRSALNGAVKAARAAGELMLKNLREAKKVSAATQHDVKLELDVRCQMLIEKSLDSAFPEIAFLGEEGSSGQTQADYRWVVDPIDGTVNFSHGIPHACVSIALQVKVQNTTSRAQRRVRRIQHPSSTQYETKVGVVYDPFTTEMFTAIRGQPARLNGIPIQVSNRQDLAECVVATGFAKSEETLRISLPYFNRLVWRVRKIRMTGAAALALAYVAAGRFDAYVERGISLWDIAAGGLMVECAGGEFWREQIAGTGQYRMVASNGLLRRKLRVS